jgi:hypothetical protein
MVQSIQINSKTKWLVVNMRGVNQFMKLTHFKMEGTRILEQLMMKDDYAISYESRKKKHTILVIQHPKSIHTNHEKSYSGNQRIV